MAGVHCSSCPVQIGDALCESCLKMLRGTCGQNVRDHTHLEFSSHFEFCLLSRSLRSRKALCQQPLPHPYIGRARAWLRQSAHGLWSASVLLIWLAALISTLILPAKCSRGAATATTLFIPVVFAPIASLWTQRSDHRFLWTRRDSSDNHCDHGSRQGQRFRLE